LKPVAGRVRRRCSSWRRPIRCGCTNVPQSYAQMISCGREKAIATQAELWWPDVRRRGRAHFGIHHLPPHHAISCPCPTATARSLPGAFVRLPAAPASRRWSISANALLFRPRASRR
jgi:hypothetical protein